MAKSQGVDYKKKYQELRAKFMSAMDVAFKQGFQQGQQSAQMQQMQMQAQQEAAMQQGQMGAVEQSQPEQQAQSDGGELDMYINELESIVNKSDMSKDDLKKSLEKIKTSRAVRSPSSSFQFNLPQPAKKALSMHEKIVGDIMKKWESASQTAASDITRQIGVEALTKKES